MMCSKGEVLIGHNKCVTYDKDSDMISLGFCPYFEIQGHIDAEPGFVSLPSNISELNSYMCDPMNRKGPLCSECKDGYGLSATLPNWKCSECTMNVWRVLLLNLLLELVPVFMFYIIILVFQINITSLPMSSFGNYNLIYVDETFYADSAIVTLYGVWTFDFLRHIVPPFLMISPYLKLMPSISSSLHTKYLHRFPLCSDSSNVYVRDIPTTLNLSFGYGKH